MSTDNDTVLGYLNRTKNMTIGDLPFNAVDSLILCQFSYLKFTVDMIPPIGKQYLAVTVRDIAKAENLDCIFADERYRTNNMALFEAMVKSRRFNHMRIHSYVDEIDLGAESQFAAMTVEFNEGLTYVIFRGTDDNLVGWKEDLNLSLAKPIPGQIKSVRYLDSVAEYLPDRFCVGGHSKGGNLAVYSAMYCDRTVCDRISDIYNHDGPGIRNEIMDEAAYAGIRGRIRMTVPHSSLVGMLLVNFDNYRVVESRNPGLMQHDPFSWKVKDYDFIYADSVKDSAALMDRSINKWVMGLDQTQIQLFLDATYDVMIATGVDNLNELRAEWTKVLPRIGNTMANFDDDTREALIKIFAALLEQADKDRKLERERQINELKQYTEKLYNKAKKIYPSKDRQRKRGR